MRLLFDENLSRRLVNQLQDLFPDAQHVALLGLEAARDSAIRDYARKQHMVIVSKDDDFRQMAYHEGPPPKFIHLSLGNAPTRRIEGLLRDQSAQINEFIADEISTVLMLP